VIDPSTLVLEITGRIDPVVRDTWRLFVSLLGGDEGSLWLRDGNGLLMVLNSGPDAASMEFTATAQSENAQVIRCLKTGAPVEDVLPFKRLPRDRRVDGMFDQETVCQISVPFLCGQERVGVLSIVQLDRNHRNRQWGFPPETARRLKIFGRTLERLLCTGPVSARTTKPRPAKART